MTSGICASVLVNESSLQTAAADFHKKEEEARSAAEEKRKLVLSRWKVSDQRAEYDNSANIVVHATIADSSKYADLDAPSLLVQILDKYDETLTDHLFMPNRDFAYDPETRRIDASVVFPDTPLAAENFRVFVCQPGAVAPQSGFEVWGRAQNLEGKDIICAIYD